ncbi:RHS repeat-associated core domain-containing protein [Enterobacter bugandensis]|uniref:RHS repeat-associated core domain-containing protein n=1 Tax=Enterobacter bugandensis TaxID=881260 RepID=UPI000665B78F|nr:RHS repeat-associated core domain-containing protein [Enterobacter bugandensis]
MMNTSITGFNGERIDPVSGHTHLGNGYRAYSPILMRFTCPDNRSPFGDGGINPYAYCTGDPVNHSDPTGHLSLQAWLGISMGIAGLGLALFTGGASIAAAAAAAAAESTAIAAAGTPVVSMLAWVAAVTADVTAIASGATEDKNPKASVVLGWVSLGAGTIGLTAGIAVAGRALRGAGLRGVSRWPLNSLRQRLRNILTTGVSGQGAIVAGRRTITATTDLELDIQHISSSDSEIPSISESPSSRANTWHSENIDLTVNDNAGPVSTQEESINPAPTPKSSSMSQKMRLAVKLQVHKGAVKKMWRNGLLTDEEFRRDNLAIQKLNIETLRDYKRMDKYFYFLYQPPFSEAETSESEV